MRLLLLLFTLAVSATGFAQSRGENVYEFLNLGTSARIAALGGDQVIVNDADADFSFYNPSQLRASQSEYISANYLNYLSDINLAYASYVKDFNKLGTFSIAMHYANYGDFTETDEYGQKIGNFKASDYALLISYGRQLGKQFRIGASLKTIYSSLERYNSYGLAIDLALTYKSQDSLFQAALVARNFGFQIEPYYGSNTEDLPKEVLLGLSAKMANAPLQFMLTYRHLEEFDLTYNSTITDDSGTNSSSDLIDKTLRHMVLGIEFLPSKNLSIRAGYNFQRREELKVEEKTSTVGLTWGLGLKVGGFNLSYASARYHLAGTSHHFSVSTSLNNFL